jgi:hypothetical protein
VEKVWETRAGYTTLMGIGMSWGGLRYGQAYGEYPTVDECAKALCRSARRTYARLGPSFRGTVLKASTRVIREEMCTKGLHAVVHGGVWVTLLPRCRCR